MPLTWQPCNQQLTEASSSNLVSAISTWHGPGISRQWNLELQVMRRKEIQQARYNDAGHRLVKHRISILSKQNLI